MFLSAYNPFLAHNLENDIFYRVSMFLQSSRTFVARVRARHWLDIDGAHALCEEGVDEKQFSVVVAQILQ